MHCLVLLDAKIQDKELTGIVGTSGTHEVTEGDIDWICRTLFSNSVDDTSIFALV